MESFFAAGEQLEGFGDLQGCDQIDDRAENADGVTGFLQARDRSGPCRRQARQAVSPGSTVMVRP